jgi:hypothetical protein
MPDSQNHLSPIPPHGRYRELKSCQMMEIVYDSMEVFCGRLRLIGSILKNKGLMWR